MTGQRISAWLQQFKTPDSDLGARLLDAVTFFKSEEIEEVFRKLLEGLPGWHKSSAQRKGKWRFVAFSISAGESGDTMLHKSRTALRLTGNRYNSLFIHKSDLLSERLGVEDTVVFVDDFAGTGQQACRAWRETLAELLPGSPRAYLVLVATGKRTYDRISQETSMKVIAKHTLGPGDDIFAAECPHFDQTEKQRLLEYCRVADPRTPRGFGDCGFTIVLAHKTPNNSIPILHANHHRWKGLFPRY